MPNEEKGSMDTLNLYSYQGILLIMYLEKTHDLDRAFYQTILFCICQSETKLLMM